MNRTVFIVLAAALAWVPSLPAGSDPLPTVGEWRYVVPPRGNLFEHPPLRALALSESKPEDVVEEVRYRGTQRRYAQLRYGSPSSVRVTVVLDEVGPYEADLYVDTGRNRRIEAKDRVKGEGLTWRLPLELALIEGDVLTTVPRTVIFRFGPVGRILSFATAGYMEGVVPLTGHTHQARRVDGDGNGQFTDAQDRLWIDLNDDGRWDGANEQFLYAPILSIAGSRYAVRSDPVGKRLQLAPLEGTGTIQLTVKPSVPAARVTDLTATLVGRDGSTLSLQGSGVPAVVPTGEYRLACATVVLEEPHGGPRWTFIFSDSGARQPARWYTVAKDGSLTIDPIGKLEMRTGLDEPAVAHPDKDLGFQPKLYTGDGLLIVAGIRGTHESAGGREIRYAELTLTTSEGTRLASARSGFM